MMMRFVVGCCFAWLSVAAVLSCVSPSLLGASALKCSDDELARLERAPMAASAPFVPVRWEASSNEAGALKAAVFNIRSGFGPRDDREPAHVTEKLAQIAATLLAAGPPDVVGLNEVDFRSRRTGFVDQAQFIAERLERAGFRYQVVRGPAWLRDTPGSEVRYGNALLVRHPIVRAHHCSFDELGQCEASMNLAHLPHASLSAPWSWLSHEPRGVVVADFDWHGRTVRAIVTHLDPFSAQLRETQAAQIVAGLVPAQGPVVLLGDMNTVPTRLTLGRRWFSADRTHDVLTAGRLLDTRSELGGDDPSNWGAWATYPAAAPRWPLDGVYASADMAAVDLQVLGSGLSDHLGLVGTLVPVDDHAMLSARQQRHALQREGRFARIQRCDLPDGGRDSFFSWLRNITSAADPVTATASRVPSAPAQ